MVHPPGTRERLGAAPRRRRLPRSLLRRGAGRDERLVSSDWAGVRLYVVVGLAVRLLLAPFTSWEKDASVWLQAAASGAYHIGLYARPVFSYPPLFGSILQTLGEVLVAVGLPVSSFSRFVPAVEPLVIHGRFSLYVTSPLFNVALKSILFSFDFGTSILTAAVVRELTGDHRLARKAFLLVFLNPFVIFESSVMAGFDIVVAFSLVLALYCAVTRRWFWCGAALAIGTATKVAPVLLVPLALLWALLNHEVGEGGRESPDTRRSPLKIRPEGLRGALLLVVGFAATGAITALSVFWSSSLGATVQTVSARYVNGAPATGGFSLYGLDLFRGLQALGRFATADAAPAHDIGLGIVGAVVVATLVLFARHGITARRIVAASVAVLAVLYLTTPLVQPQYLLWVLPLLIVMHLSTRRLRLPLLVFSIAPIVVFLFAWGPAAVAFPLAAFTSVASTTTITSAITSWAANLAGGGFAVKATAVPGALMTTAVLIAELDLLWAAFGTLLGRTVPDRRRSPGTMSNGESRRAASTSRPAAFRLGQVLAGASLAASLVAAFTIGTGKPVASVRLEQASTSADELSLAVGVVPSAAQSAVRMVAFRVRPETVPLSRIFVFEDMAMRSTGTPASASAALVTHLRDELVVRRLPVSVRSIGPAQLHTMLLTPSSAAGTAVIDIAGALPASDGGKSADLFRPWLSRGGVLVWSGELPAGIVSCPRQSCPRIRRRSFQTALPTPTPMSMALGISFRMAAFGLPDSSLTFMGGTALGWSGRGVSSVSAIPAGRGEILLFSSPMLESDFGTEDLTALLMTNAYAASSGPIWTTKSLPSRAGRGVTIRWDLRLPARVGRSSRVSVVVMDPDHFGIMLRSFLVTVRN